MIGGGESTALMAETEEYGVNGGVGHNEGSVKLLVDNPASKHYSNSTTTPDYANYYRTTYV